MPTLNWIGKEHVKKHLLEMKYSMIHCDGGLSIGEAGEGNLLIEGDNLAGLKALQPYYAGTVKCIVIDPPYNTGNQTWVYNDNINAPEIKDWLGKTVGDEDKDFTRHDKWLCMMYPRMALLHKLLREDGAIFVCIDDNEVANLRFIMDDIFEPKNFVACFVWQKRYSRDNRPLIGTVHDYILLYAKDIEQFAKTRHLLLPDEANTTVYRNPNHDPKGRWRPVPMTAQGTRPNQMYKITAPSGVVHLPPKGRCWSMVEAEYLKLHEQGRIWFGSDGTSQPNVIRYLSEIEGFVPWTWWPHTETGHNDEAKKEIHQFFGKENVFDTPKPTRLIKRMLQIATDKDSLVLDTFAGSGTTGEAVMQLNAEDGGKRRFILMELEPEICRNITLKRLKGVIQGHDVYSDVATEDSPIPSTHLFEEEEVSEPKDMHRPGLGGGLRYCVLGKPLFNPDGALCADVKFSDLAHHIFFTETGEPIPQKADPNCPLIGCWNGVAIYLFWTGMGQETILSLHHLRDLPPFHGTKIIYADGCEISAERLAAANIVFRQIPYDVKVS